MRGIICTQHVGVSVLVVSPALSVKPRSASRIPGRFLLRSVLRGPLLQSTVALAIQDVKTGILVTKEHK